MSSNIILHGLLPTVSTPPPVFSFIGELGLGTKIVSTSTSSLLRSISNSLKAVVRLKTDFSHLSQITDEGPVGDELKPVMVYIHGGGYTGGDY